MKSYIVVGGGILGASTAYHLAISGASVTLVDRSDQGQATNAGAGIICPWLSEGRSEAWHVLGRKAAKYYPTLIDELGKIGEVKTGYVRLGAMSIHTDASELTKIEEQAWKRKESAPEIGDITRLSSQETKAMFPPLADGYEAIYVSGGAQVDGKLLRDSLIRAAQKEGAKIIKGNASLLQEGNQVIGVKIGAESFHADDVIVTSGAWSRELLAPLHTSFQVKPQKGQIVHLRMKNTDNQDWPVILPPSDYYMLNFGKGHVVVGATREDNKGFDYRVTASGMQEVLNVALTLAPGLANSEIIDTRIGFRPFTPNCLPVIGSVPHLKGLLIADGLGATGLTLGPYLGSQLANLALGRKVDVNLSDYSVSKALINY